MSTSSTPCLPSLIVVALVAASVLVILAPQSIPAAPTAGPESDTSTNSMAAPTNSVAPPEERYVVRHQLTGAELYSVHCNRCHPERYPTERTAAQWKTIMLHMQVRANLPVSQAKLILKYLQDNSGR